MSDDRPDLSAYLPDFDDAEANVATELVFDLVKDLAASSVAARKTRDDDDREAVADMARVAVDISIEAIIAGGSRISQYALTVLGKTVVDSGRATIAPGLTAREARGWGQSLLDAIRDGDEVGYAAYAGIILKDSELLAKVLLLLALACLGVR